MLTGTVDQAELQKRRMKAVRLSEKDIAPAEVARRLGVHRQSATRGREEWLADGRQALECKGRIGRKRGLTPEQEAEFAAVLEAGAGAAGMPTEAWILPRVAKLVRERFGVDYLPGAIKGPQVVDFFKVLARQSTARDW